MAKSPRFACGLSVETLEAEVFLPSRMEDFRLVVVPGWSPSGD